MLICQRTALAWNQISARTVRRSWWKLHFDEKFVNEAKVFCSNTKLVEHFQYLGYEIEEVYVEDWWLESDELGYKHFSDD